MDDTTDWYGPEAATFGDRLAAAREAAAMSQEDLARRLGVKLDTLRRWEEDLAEPRANRLNMVSGLLNVSMIWLITGEGEGVASPDEDPLPSDIDRALVELRSMQTQMKRQAEKMGKLEKHLRALLKEHSA